jgi:hypothetical protein
VHRMSYVAVRCASRRHAGAHRVALYRWQVIVIEDADRITERGADALLRASRSRPLERCGSCVLRQLTMSWRPFDRDVDC